MLNKTTSGHGVSQKSASSIKPAASSQQPLTWEIFFPSNHIIQRFAETSLLLDLRGRLATKIYLCCSLSNSYTYVAALQKDKVFGLSSANVQGQRIR
jgi:hypothetical protein